MKRKLLVLAAVLLCTITFASPAFASEPDQAAQIAKTVPGSQQVAQTISQITGVAISPLMGVGAVGAWKYYHTPPELRAKLPWYADPLFFVPALLLVGVCFIKDTAGTALPTVVKKPLDVVETCEHKISGLVATGAFVPIAAAIFHAPASTGASLGGAGFAAIDLHWFYNGLMIPISMVAFFIVFLASNAINILILMSPFTTVDAALKGFRTAILATVAVSAWANPWIGAAWALIIIGISYFIAGWSFRLSHFGIVFVWEFLTVRRKRFTPDAKTNNLFLSRKLNNVPARTYGKLSRDEKGQLVLNYRPWLVLTPRTLVLPEGKYCVGQGAFFSEILKIEGDSTKDVILLPPRYRSHEQQVASIYGLEGVRPIGLLAAWAWLKGLFGSKPGAVTA